MRGSTPTPGRNTVRYGGNTSCVEIRCGDEIIILDAGTGMRELGISLLKEFKKRTLNLTLLITHTHWDHIQGLPFFSPIYNSNCHLRIVGFEGARKGLVDALTGQMESLYFPVPFTGLPSNIHIDEITDYKMQLGPVHVDALRANHPGLCVGYRVLCSHGTIVYFPDTEPRRGGDPEMVEFIRDADVLILDSQYDRAEYKKHVGWGHGCIDDSVALALRAGVKRLCLFHHDPSHSDRRVDELAAHGRSLVAKKKGKLKVDAAREGMTIVLR